MSQLVIFKRKQRQGPAPALTSGKSYQVIEQKERHGNDMVLIANDSGVNRWYHRDDFMADQATAGKMENLQLPALWETLSAAAHQARSIEDDLVAAQERIKTLEQLFKDLHFYCNQQGIYSAPIQEMIAKALSPNPVNSKEDGQS